MKYFRWFWVGLVLTSCSVSQKSSDPVEMKLDPAIEEQITYEQKAFDRRKTWEFSKLEEHYAGLKRKPFYFLDELLERAIKEKNWNKAEFYAKDLLTTSEKFKDDWNYGNGIFYGNMALAGVALKHGNKKLALERIRKASLTPGSPQLNSFGPLSSSPYNEILTEIFNLGERQALIDFANNCKRFAADNKSNKDKENSDRVNKWNLDQLNRFIEQVSKNQTPDFKKYM